MLLASSPQAARDGLVAALGALRRHGLPASPALLSSLALLHSYLLVKLRVRQGDHAGEAQGRVRYAC